MNSIYTRRSYRTFLDKKVEDDKIDQLLKAAMQAPSAGNQQPWEFIVVEDKDIIDELSTSSPYATCCKNALTCIVVCKKKNNLKYPEFSDIDCAISCQNIMLEAENLGLGSVMLGIAPINERIEKVNHILNLVDLDAFALIPIGYPNKKLPSIDRYNKDKIHKKSV